jgi:hypothetical protein
VGARSSIAAAGAPQNDASMTALARDQLQFDPEECIRVAREANERFPGSSDAPERASLVVKSLMRQGRAAEATAEARAMVDTYPGSMWALDVKRHMLDIPGEPLGGAP